MHDARWESVWSTALAVLATTAAAIAQTPPPADEPELALGQRITAAQAELAETAFGLDLFREASSLAASVLRRAPEHAVVELQQRVKRVDVDDFVRRYREASGKHGRPFRKRARERLQPLAEELFALAEQAAGAADDERAERLFVGVFELDPDHGKALQALKKRDYDAIFNYGVLPKADKLETRRLLKALGGGFLGRSDLAPELEQWVDAWGLQTRHYRLVTDAPHGLVFAFAQACEDLHEALEQFMTAAKQPLRDLGKPCTIHLFRSKVDYECLLRLQGVDPPDSDEALGFYFPTTKVGYFYHDPAFYGGDPTLLFETFYHEGAHQMFDLRWRAPWRGDAKGAQLHWVEEGFAVYLESLVIEGEGGKRKSRFGTVIDDDLARALEAMTAGELLPMQQFAHIDHDGWNEYAAGYPHAALVVHWLLTGDGGKRAGKAFELLLAERQTAGLRKGTLFDVLAMTPEAIDAALRAHASAIGGSLPRRKYPE